MAPPFDMCQWAPRLEIFRGCIDMDDPMEGGGYWLAKGPPSLPPREAWPKNRGYLLAALRSLTQEEWQSLLSTLGLGSWSLGEWHKQTLAGGVVELMPRVGSVTLRIAGAHGDSPSLTEADYAHAQRVEPLLQPYRHRVVDPPLDSPECLCPKYHLDLWDWPPRAATLEAVNAEDRRLAEEVRLTLTVAGDTLQQLEALYTDSSPEPRRRLEALLGFIRDIVDETRLVSADTPGGYTLLRTRSDFNSWASRYFSPPVLPPRQEAPPLPVRSAEPPPARAQPREEPRPQELHPSTASSREEPRWWGEPSSLERWPGFLTDLSGTWEDPVWLGGRPRKRVVLEHRGNTLNGEVWDFLHAGHGPNLVHMASVTGTVQEDGSAQWAGPREEWCGPELVRGRFSGDTFQGVYLKEDGHPDETSRFELRRVSRSTYIPSDWDPVRRR